jgi:hypothetical protein
LGERSSVQLFHHALPVGFYRSHGRSQFMSNLLVDFAPHHPHEYLAFARCQRIRARTPRVDGLALLQRALMARYRPPNGAEKCLA